MGKVSESQKRATENYRKTHKDSTKYTSLRRGGLSFARAGFNIFEGKTNSDGTPKVSSAYRNANTPYATKVIDGEQRRITDMKNMVRYSAKTLKAWGVSQEEINKLIK
ncbi:hypothetical protein [Limosilactobacillus reuteri]|uniref:hypothetical protein n=1 Tax=Limosilactobacillus reuteri TaxID=1598 RepID=UPI00195D89AA|nr:hypothetical protein [Limosilactobacillus reuteri]MBM6812226.1 hypothetical protein [Limosilactobacillus reuteri]